MRNRRQLVSTTKPPNSTGLKSDYDQLCTPIRKVASNFRQLANDAYHIYAVEVASIINTHCQDTSRIEHTFDGLLGFCYDDRLVQLDKALGRYYVTLNAQATVEYIDAYREMWDSEASNE